MDAQYTSVAQTVRDGESANVAMSNKRVLLTAQADASTGAPVSLTDPVQTYQANSYINITTKTTTVVKGSAGTLTRLIVNKLGSADTIALYDNTAGSGTLVGTFTAPTVGSYTIDALMGTGITVVTGGTTAGDYTIIYR